MFGSWFCHALALVATTLFLTCACRAQIPQEADTTSTPTIGVGHDYIHAPLETVNPANGSVSIRIPVRMPAGRQLTVPFSFAYDSNGANYLNTRIVGSLVGLGWTTSSAVFSQGGWSETVPMMSVGSVVYSVPGTILPNTTQTCGAFVNYVFQDQDGDRHDLDLSIVGYTGDWEGGHCTSTTGFSNFPQGGEDSMLATTTAPGSGQLDGSLSLNPVQVTLQSGTIFNFPLVADPISGGTTTWTANSITDRNGNLFTIHSNTTTFSYVDTLGRTALSDSGFAKSPETITMAGLTSPYTVTWAAIGSTFTASIANLDTSGLGSCPTPSHGGSNAISTIALPNGRQFSFMYDSAYGMLSRITYPSGGYVRYVWGLNPQSEASIFPSLKGCEPRYDTPAIVDRYVSYDGTNEVLHQHFAYSTTWSGPTSTTWTSKQTTVTTTDLVRGTSYQTVYTYSAMIPDFPPNTAVNLTTYVPVENTVVYHDTNGSLLETVAKTWDNPRLIEAEQTTLPTGQSFLTTTCYNSNAEISEQDEFDLGTGPASLPACANGHPSGAVAGPLLRKTVTNYATFTGAHIVDLPSSVITYDGSGNRVAETDSSYDQTGLQPTSVVQHGAAPGGTAAGNLTTVTRDCFVGAQTCASGNPAAVYSYFDTGQVYQMTDPNNNITKFSYADSYSPCGGNAPSAGATNAYLTQVTHPQTGTVNHIESYCYDYSAGLLLESTDENGQNTTYSYTDPLDRLKQTNYPDTGQTIVSYNDVGPTPTVTTEKKLDTSGRFVTTVSTTNGMGLSIETDLTTDPQGTDTTTTAYDGLGRVQTESNPHRSGDPNYVTTSAYDALNRTTSVTKQDGSVVSISYSGSCTSITDEQGVTRTSCTDALGRVISATEDPGSNPHLNYVTTYTYDALDNLTSVVQNGSRNRSFTYDSLSRLTQSVNPESGTIKYSYDANGNLISKIAPLENQTGSATVTTTDTYDALNRMKEKQFTDGTPTVFYNYDGVTQTGCAATITDSNPTGRRTGMCDAAGSEAWSHDSMGRTLIDQRTTNGVTKSVVYTYQPYLNGAVANIVYPSGLSLTYTYDGAGRFATARDQHSDAYSAGTCGSSGACYAPQGAIQSATFGATSNFAGFNLSNSYNSRLQPNEMKVTNSGATVMDQSYCFYALSGGKCPSGGATDNGNVMAIINNVDATRSQTFTYDPLNRIATAGTVNLSGTHCWDEKYTYDPWGNLLSIGAVSGYSGCTQPDNLNVSVTTNNQISGYTYDAAGNLITIPGTGGSTYTYDAENELTTSSAGANYIYDGDGKRVEKSTGTLYWYGMGSEVLEKTGLTGSVQSDFVFFDGERVGSRNTTSTVTYFMDHLGSTRMSASVATGASTATIQWDADYYPFGRSKTYLVTSAPAFQFTGKELDSETGLDDFGARYYSSNLGRFMSVDPSQVGVKLDEPQTWNAYAYCLNNPLAYTDPNGEWSTRDHNMMIEVVFKGFSAYDIARIEDGSAEVDKDQSMAGSYKHGMFAPWQAFHPWEAFEEGQEFISDNLDKAVKAQLAWEDFAPNGTNSPVALFYLGEALHTVMDRESPWHEQVWWGVLNPAASFSHAGAEFSIGRLQTQAIAMTETQMRQLWAEFQKMLEEARRRKEKEFEKRLAKLHVYKAKKKKKDKD